MKTEAEIRHKLSQVRFRHLKRELRTGLSRRPSNCVSNGKIELPLYGHAGICLHEKGGGGLCDEVLGETTRPEKCSLFVCAHRKESLKEDFDTFLATSNRAEVAARYPDMAALLWVLDQETEASPEAPEETGPSATSSDEVGASLPPPAEPEKASVQDFSRLNEVLSPLVSTSVPTAIVLREPKPLWEQILGWISVLWGGQR